MSAPIQNLSSSSDSMSEEETESCLTTVSKDLKPLPLKKSTGNKRIRVEESTESFYERYPSLKKSLKYELAYGLNLYHLFEKYLSKIGDIKAKEMDEKWCKLFEKEAEIERESVELQKLMHESSKK
ncbi:uncharacterized protein LOC124915921 [Impatiens glandulifera]|uniref:uncharacterized protein LOC124915921 n=1 Tax=Impatiens glandulifera TaxID=253017 RepID=UPI001FB05ADF|nr:uncharacterized protein LOC124915921 [Impatiens glandulifera]